MSIPKLTNIVDEKLPMGKAAVVATNNYFKQHSNKKPIILTFLSKLFENRTPDYPKGIKKGFRGGEDDPRIIFIMNCVNAYKNPLDNCIIEFVAIYFACLGISKDALIKYFTQTMDRECKEAEKREVELRKIMKEELPLGEAMYMSMYGVEDKLGSVPINILDFLFIMFKGGTPNYPLGITEDLKGDESDPRVKMIRTALEEYGLIDDSITMLLRFYLGCLEISLAL